MSQEIKLATGRQLTGIYEHLGRLLNDLSISLKPPYARPIDPYPRRFIMAQAAGRRQSQIKLCKRSYDCNISAQLLGKDTVPVEDLWLEAKGKRIFVAHYYYNIEPTEAPLHHMPTDVPNVVDFVRHRYDFPQTVPPLLIKAQLSAHDQKRIDNFMSWGEQRTQAFTSQRARQILNFLNHLVL